jgi:recombination protein RecA
MSNKKTTSKHVDVDKKVNKDDLAQMLALELNKANKDGGKAAYFLSEQDDPSTISDWISTGSSMLDLAVSNRPNGGLPVGRITTLTGLEGTGKSLICAHLVAETQKKGGVAVYIDTEAASAPEFWAALGVDLSKMLYVPEDTIEGAFQKIEDIIGLVRKSDSDRLCTIILDSIAGASTKMEKEAGYERKGFATGKALIVSEAMRKLTWLVAKRRVLLVFTNQLRQNLNAMAFGDKWIEPCGKATSFHSSVKIRFETIEKLKNSVKDVIGVSTRSTVRKNRMGPPFRQAEFDIYFASGIADYASWIETAVKRGILTGPKNNLAYNGEKFNVQSFVKRLNEDSEFKDKFYNEIVTSCILTYESPNQTVVDKDSVITDKNVDATEVIEAEE